MTNRLLRSASTGTATRQMLHNTSFELGSWTLDGTSVDTTQPRTGTKSLTGTTSNAEIEQSAQTTSVALVQGETYTYRDITSRNTTTQVASLTYDLPADQSYRYTNVTVGNMSIVDAQGNVVASYNYDSYGNLISDEHA